jgi:hypothetical protein
VKSLLFLLIVASFVCLVLHDRQQTNDLDRANADLDTVKGQNSDLTTKVNALQQQIASLQARLQQPAPTAISPAPAPAPRPAAPASPGAPSYNSPLGNSPPLLKDPDSLNRKSY